MITQNQAIKEQTHTDAEGNIYKVLGDKPQEFCVFYWNQHSNQWFQDLGKDFSYLIKLEKAYAATQCKAPCGTVGTFLFYGKDENGYVLASPVFASHVELASWLKENNWKAFGGLNGWYEKK
jgi:hypothetical protein